MVARERRGLAIERLIASDHWAAARLEILRARRADPHDHWLLTRLALTHYEQGHYRKALEIDQRALGLARDCPLALWGVAGALQMLNRPAEAGAVYRRIIRRGSARLARGPCGEGVRWARGLVADCWYRLGLILESAGEWRRARRAYLEHLLLRRGGASIYPATEVRARARRMGTHLPPSRRGGAARKA